MTKIKALNYIIRVINMKRLRNKNNHRYNQEKNDLEVMAALQEIKQIIKEYENEQINKERCKICRRR